MGVPFWGPYNVFKDYRNWGVYIEVPYLGKSMKRGSLLRMPEFLDFDRLACRLCSLRTVALRVPMPLRIRSEEMRLS